MRKYILSLLAILFTLCTSAQQRITVYKIFDEINSTTWIYTQGAFQQATDNHSDCVILHLNTYGGEVVYADSIRTKILNSPIPVYAFIDNNAASAGALISIACDSIYMRAGGSIGAATVVNGANGEKMPDKYQSYMRSTMRATAEAHGRDSLGRWHRDPIMAEAMVDEDVAILGVVDSGKILTLTTEEAIKYHMCEGKASSIEEVADIVCESEYVIEHYEPTKVEEAKGFLLSTTLRGLLIMIILGGIYFELQTPGLGFPTLVAVGAAILYFAPLYIDGLAANWEIVIFILGLVLLAVEIFIIPGFGVAGISGALCIIAGLTFSLIDNDGFSFDNVSVSEITNALLMVCISFTIGLIGCLLLSRHIVRTRKGPLAKLMLTTEQNVSDGYIGTVANMESLVGCIGTASTDLRPSGKVCINDESYDAITSGMFISKGVQVIVKDVSTNQVVVDKTLQNNDTL